MTRIPIFCLIIVFPVFLKSGSFNTSCGGRRRIGAWVGICFWRPCPLCPFCAPCFLPVFSLLFVIFSDLRTGKMVWKNSHSYDVVVLLIFYFFLFLFPIPFQFYKSYDVAWLLFRVPHLVLFLISMLAVPVL